MLMTEGREEHAQRANAQRSRNVQRTLQRAGQGGSNHLRLYAQNPRMVPAQLTPTVHKTLLTAPAETVTDDGPKKGRARGKKRKEEEKGAEEGQDAGGGQEAGGGEGTGKKSARAQKTTKRGRKRKQVIESDEERNPVASGDDTKVAAHHSLLEYFTRATNNDSSRRSEVTACIQHSLY